jgi:hypothetical protein
MLPKDVSHVQKKGIKLLATCVVVFFRKDGTSFAAIFIRRRTKKDDGLIF